MAQTTNSAMAASPEDVWVPTVCRVCANCCGLRVHRRNGVIVKIEGHPENPHNSGRICAKGMANIMSIYDPARLGNPLVRTNPEKGPSIDPKWRETSWEEAMDVVAAGIRKVLAEDPRKLVILRSTTEPDWVNSLIGAFAEAVGTPNWAGGPFFATHVKACYLINGTMHVEIDLPRCRYLMLFGSQRGGNVGHDTMRAAREMAEARARGMKLVVIDPICSPVASQASEWVPIRPGSDGALALALAHVLVNELGMYDRAFLQAHTNAPYLVGGDGHYARDRASGKPLAWDEARQQARPFDFAQDRPFDQAQDRPFDQALRVEHRSPQGGQDRPFDAGAAHALEGTYQVEGAPCQPAFSRLKEHLKHYTPEAVAQATTVPPERIRRLAREFGEAASIGSTIVMEGRAMPYRPACTFCDSRGLSSHQFGLWASINVHLLNLLVGALDVPGGSLSTNIIGPTGQLRVEESGEGLVVSGLAEERAYPAQRPQAPQTLGLKELFPLGRPSATVMMGLSLLEHPNLLPYRPEMLIVNNFNMMMSGIDPDTLARVLQQFRFMVFLGDRLTETAELADVFLPILQPAQRLDFPMNALRGWVNGDQWYYTLRQPVLPQEREGKHTADIYFELAERLGILAQVNPRLDASLSLKEPYHLEASRRYGAGEILDRSMKSTLDAEHGLEWFKEKGFLAFPRKLEQKFPRALARLPRVPIYFEFLIDTGRQLDSIARELGLDVDVRGFQPLPCWYPCAPHEHAPPDYDLTAVNYKLAFHAYTMTQDNPWLAELADHHPYAYKIMVNSETAARKGIADGALIEVETSWGRKAQGIAKVSQCIHPEVIGIAGSFGHWARERPIARHKGVHFNALVPYSLSQIDPMTCLMDACVRVRIRPAPARR